MAYLNLVKSLSRLKDEQEYIDEILLDHLGLPFPRGSIIEAAGSPSSGKTSLALTLLAKLTKTGEICAVVDASNSFDPETAFLAGVELENILWVKCGGNMEKAFMAADYLVQAKGFGAIWLNLSGLPERQLRMVPRTYWFRYRTRIKETPTIVLVTANDPLTGSASQRSFTLSREDVKWSGTGKFKLLREFHIDLTSRKHLYGPPTKITIEMDYTDV